jgi:uncharacterized protein (UPF0262 family)
MSLEKVVIDERTWGDADDARRLEWQRSIEKLLEEPELLAFVEGARALHVAVSGQATTLELRDASGASLGSAVVPRSALSEHVTEYVDIVRQLDAAEQGIGSARLEVLDMAKKLAHDDAAKTIEKLCAPLGVDHETSRRLWTLLLTLRVDTTRLTGVRGHRPVRR